MTIIEEILAYRAAELRAGRKAETIDLSPEQYRRLQAWADAQDFVIRDPSGKVRKSIKYDPGCGEIFGMKFSIPEATERPHNSADLDSSG